MRRRLLSLFFLVNLVLLGGCDVAGDNQQDEPTPRAVVVANQGNFGDGNGSVSTFDPVTETVQAAAIASLGSIVQSVTIEAGQIYVMANTGGRVDVFDAESLERTAQIGDVVSPRYMVAEGSTGYVTSLYGEEGSFSGGLVTVLDLDARQKTAEISVGNNPEGLALVGTRLYVANHGFGNGTTVSVVDTGSLEVAETIEVECDGPRFLEADADGDVFVFCTGKTIYDDSFNPVGETDGAVRVLDGATGEIVTRMEIDGRIGTVGPGQDAFHAPSENAIFVVKDQNTVLVFDTGTDALAEEIGPFDGQPISAVGYDERSARLYVGRSHGFTQAGEVSIHDRSGIEISRFTAGVVPTFIAFQSDNQ
ncbi:MAG: YncE family protein [Rhodothermales bacterium]